MQRHQPLHAGETSESSRLPRSEMATHRGCVRVHVEKCRFDEKNVGLSSQPNDLFGIRIRKGAIDDIDDFAPRGDFHDIFLQQAKRKGGGLFGLGVTPGDIDKSVVVRAAEGRLLECAEPWPDSEPHGLDLVAPHVDLSPLLEGESEHRHAMVQRDRADLHAELLEDEAVAALPLFAIGAMEARVSGELRGLQAAGVVDLRHAEGEIPVIALDEIPSIRLELVFNRVIMPAGPKTPRIFDQARRNNWSKPAKWSIWSA